MSWSEEDERQLQRLLLIEREWEKHANPPMPPLNAPAPATDAAQTHEKISKPPEPSETKPKHFIDQICPEGSDKPSGKALGKDSWMG
jgi:hypothetical protein